MTLSDFEKWLKKYGKAWMEGNPGNAILLFSENARYYEEPFLPPMVGHDAIRKYWTEGAEEGQRDITFDFQVLTVSGDTGYARWQASFRRVASGRQVELDGVLSATFDGNGHCTEFREWWHRRES